MLTNTKVRSRFALRVLWVLCALAISIPVLSRASDHGGQGFEVLPDSLARWYKPENKRQVWLHTMFAMRRELQAVLEYAELRDTERLQKWTERLAEHYRKIPEMVPEWEDEVDLETLGHLERAAGEGDLKQTVAAAKRLGRTCRSCHNEFRSLVAARYRAPRFDAIKVPYDGGPEQQYADHMKDLSRNLNRVKIASEDGRWEAAGLALTSLRTGLEQLGETCPACHEDEVPRQRILGEEAQASLDEIAVGVSSKEQKRVGRYLGQAAVQVCARCHGVHRILSDLTDRLSPLER